MAERSFVREVLSDWLGYLQEKVPMGESFLLECKIPNQELSALYGGPTLNYGKQLSLYVPYMLRVNMTGDLAHLQLSD